jgi:hypothetical protein
MSLVPAPIAAVLERMDGHLDRFDAAEDYRAVFCRAYRHTTLRVGEAIGRGEFLDAAWMTRLDVRFADYYFDALDAWERHLVPPEPWVVCFEEAELQRSSVVQDLILGMNAHLNHDLVLAIVDVLGPDDDLAQRRRDHDHINTVLARIVDEVQDEITSRYSLLARLLDVAFWRFDEIAATRVITYARDHAWAHVLQVRGASDPLGERRWLGTHVAGLAHTLVAPNRLPFVAQLRQMSRRRWLRMPPRFGRGTTPPPSKG